MLSSFALEAGCALMSRTPTTSFHNRLTPSKEKVILRTRLFTSYRLQQNPTSRNKFVSSATPREAMVWCLLATQLTDLSKLRKATLQESIERQICIDRRVLGHHPRFEIVVNTSLTIAGQSGSPCVNQAGQVIGILSRADPADKQRCYLVPTREFSSW